MSNPSKPFASDVALSTSAITAARRVWATAFVRGALFLVFGLLMFLWPNIAFNLTKWLLIILLALQAALFSLEGARQAKGDTDAQVWRYALAVVAVVAVIALLIWPHTTIQVVLRLVAVWALISGVLGVLSALRRFRARKPAWDWELTTSLLWVIFGMMFLVRSPSSVAVVVAALSVYLTITGVVLLVAAWSLRVYRKDAAKAAAGAPDAGASLGGGGVAASGTASLGASSLDPMAMSASTAPIPRVQPNQGGHTSPL